MPRAVASSSYVMNPFVYGRINYGQLPLIAGYALLPWIAGELIGLMKDPTWRRAILLALELTALGVLDLHLLIPVSLLLLVAPLALELTERDPWYFCALLNSEALAIGVVVTAIMYCLTPILLGTNSEGRAIASVGSADLSVYSASQDPQLGLIPNLLGLYGFWAEDT